MGVLPVCHVFTLFYCTTHLKHILVLYLKIVFKPVFLLQQNTCFVVFSDSNFQYIFVGFKYLQIMNISINHQFTICLVNKNTRMRHMFHVLLDALSLCREIKKSMVIYIYLGIMIKTPAQKNIVYMSMFENYVCT